MTPSSRQNYHDMTKVTHPPAGKSVFGERMMIENVLPAVRGQQAVAGVWHTCFPLISIIQGGVDIF